MLQTLALQLKGTGLIDDDLLDEILANPDKYEKEMEEATSKMMEMFSDPNTFKDIASMMTNMGEMLNDPDKLSETMEDTMNELLLTLSAELDSDEKIEESRQVRK